MRNNPYAATAADGSVTTDVALNLVADALSIRAPFAPWETGRRK